MSETRVTQIMREIKEELQPALRPQQAGSESRAALSCGLRVREAEEAQES